MKIVCLWHDVWPGQGILHESVPLSLGGVLKVTIESGYAFLPCFGPLGAAQHKLGKNKEEITVIGSLLVEGGWVFQQGRANVLPKTDEIPGNVSFGGNRLSRNRPYILPSAWAWPFRRDIPSLGLGESLTLGPGGGRSQRYRIAPGAWHWLLRFNQTVL